MRKYTRVDNEVRQRWPYRPHQGMVLILYQHQLGTRIGSGREKGLVDDGRYLACFPIYIVNQENYILQQDRRPECMSTD